MKKYYLILLTVLAFSEAQSQDLNPRETINKNPGRLIIKWAPLSLLDFNQSIQFALEYKVKPLVSFQNELGYISIYTKNNEYDYYKNFNGLRGIRTRFEARFYQRNASDNVTGLYLAPEILFIHTTFQRTGDLGRGCSNGRCNYFERTTYTINKNVFAYHFKIGYQKISPRLGIVFDVYGGLGIRHVFLHSPDTEIEQDRLSSENSIIPSSIGTFNQGIFIRPSASLGIKIGYLIR